MEDFKGEVIYSESKDRGCGGRMTLLSIATNKNVVEYFQLPGQHRIDIGENIRVKYENNSNVNWIRIYDILDSTGKLKYSSTCE